MQRKKALKKSKQSRKRPKTSASNTYNTSGNDDNARKKSKTQQQQQQQDITEDYIPLQHTIITDDSIKAVLQSLKDTLQITTADQSTLADPTLCIRTVDTNSPMQTTVRLLFGNHSSAKTGLVAAGQGIIEQNAFIIECRGQMCIDRSDKLNADSRFLFACPHSDLMIDASTRGNESRFLRVSCRPNAVLCWMSGNEHNLIRVGVFALQKIIAEQEITVEHNNKLSRIDPNDCACGDYETCGFREEQQTLDDTQMDHQQHLNNEEPILQGNLSRRQSQSSEKNLSVMEYSNNNGAHDTDPPNKPVDVQSTDPDDIFQKSDRELSREERKIKDELIRFARMERKTTGLSQTGGVKKRSTTSKLPNSPTINAPSPVVRNKSMPQSSSTSALVRTDRPLSHPMESAMVQSDNENITVSGVPSPKSYNGRNILIKPVANKRPAPGKKRWLKMFTESTTESENEKGRLDTPKNPNDSAASVPGPLPHIPIGIFRPIQSHLMADMVPTPPMEEITRPDVIREDIKAPVAQLQTSIVPDTVPKEVAPELDLFKDDVVTVDLKIKVADLKTEADIPVVELGVSDDPPVELSPPTPVATKQRISLKDYKRRKTAGGSTTTLSPLVKDDGTPENGEIKKS